ncbi:hypothetical protein P171DRAFT_447867 [Karstenula rhodostoma CBS 690.94]|uniref:Uncharacterized protein n=1 Tax=Karstenula rhodostoma CBS 690.94 TaxID=1392251 RepID=A0A9P4P9N1_9PLEO|nr:hypothetical protein P171DRAFT_447867 [Karstenula rhodostoma CBS 690.94]
MSTTLTSSITPNGEQQELLRGIWACATKISTINAGRLKHAVEALEKATHRSPLLPFLGPAGLRELVDRLEDRLQGGEQDAIEAWVRKYVGNIKAYKKAEEELEEAEARVEFYELQGKNAEELFLYTIMYERKRQKAKEIGEAFPLDYAAWIRTQPAITFDLSSLGKWLERKREEGKKYQEADVSEEQWKLAREVADTLKGKRIVDGGDKRLLGL